MPTLFERLTAPFRSAPADAGFAAAAAVVKSAAAPVPAAQPVDAKTLRSEIAGPSMMTARSVITGHPAEGLTPERLGALLRGAEDGDPIAYLELAEQMEEKDLHYLSVLGTRKRAVSQLPITVKAASDAPLDQAAADLVREWVERDTLETELFDILDAVGKGFSNTEILWDLSGDRWFPSKLKWRDPRWFLPDRIDGETMLLRGAGPPMPLPPYKFILHVHPSKSGLPMRSGLARPVAWAYLFKNYAVKDWVAFAEIYGMPFRVGRYDNGETEENIRKLMRAVADIGSDAAAVMPKSMEVLFIENKTTGSADLFERLANFLDMQVSKAVLGQTATTDAVIGGLGSGKEHGDVRSDIERADSKLLAATLNRDVVRPLVELNLGPMAKYPRIVIGGDEPVNVKTMADALAQLVPLGLKVDMGEVRDKLRFSDPADDAELLAAPAPPPQILPPGIAPPGAPLKPQEVPGGPNPAKNARSAFLDLLKLTPGAIPVVASTTIGDLPAKSEDLIDQGVVAALDSPGGAAATAALVDGLLEQLQAAPDFDAARTLLDQMIAQLDSGDLAEGLARAMFAAHIAGDAGK